MDSTEGRAERLPIDFLRLLFARLSARDLCAAACTCRLWNQLTQECWREKVLQRWKHGTARWRALTQRGEWKQLYRERHLHDCATRVAVQDLPWPVRREAALAALVAAGDDALDELLAAAAAAAPLPPPPPALGPGPRGQGCVDSGRTGSAGSLLCGGCRGGASGDHDDAEEHNQQHHEQHQQQHHHHHHHHEQRHYDCHGDQKPKQQQWRSPSHLRPHTRHLLGQRYWVEVALAALRKRKAVCVLQRVVGDPRVAEERLEVGALAIAQAHYPTADLSGLEVELKALGGELRRRMAAEGAPPGSLQALRILNHLLFGPPPPSSPSSCATSSPTPAPAVPADRRSSTSISASSLPPSLSPPPPPPYLVQPPAPGSSPPAAAAAAAAKTAVLAKLAGAGGGLGICHADDYDDPANSMLCDVLARRRGIPISLALLHLAVARKGGLGGRLEMIGLPSRVVNRFVPTVQEGEEAVASGRDGGARVPRGGIGGSASNSSSGSPGSGKLVSEDEEIFIDVYDGGALHSWAQLRLRMARLGVSIERSDVCALSPGQMYDRMCGNLYNIYKYWNNMTCVRLILELCGAVGGQSRNLLIRRCEVSMALEDWSDAAECLDSVIAGLSALQPPSPPPQPPSEQLQSWVAPAGAQSVGGQTPAMGAALDGADEERRQQLVAQISRRRRELDDRRSAWQSRSVSQKHRPPGVLFPVGTMVQHRKYGYRGVIVDWDTSCKMRETWIIQMGVDSLPGGGRHQPFYRVLVSDRHRSDSSTSASNGANNSGDATTAAAAGGCGSGRSGVAAAPVAAAAHRDACPQVWFPVGPGSELRGHHNRPRAEETYVAQVNLQLLVPMPVTSSQLSSASPLGTAAAAADTTMPLPPPRPPKPYEHLAEAGVTMVAMPYDFEVHHPELGRYFEVKVPGLPRYRLNAALRHRFPGDNWEGWEGTTAIAGAGTGAVAAGNGAGATAAFVGRRLGGDGEAGCCDRACDGDAGFYLWAWDWESGGDAALRGQ